MPQTYALVGNSLFNFGLDQSVASILAEFTHPTDTVVQQITFNQNLTTNWNDPAGRTTGIDVKAYLASDYGVPATILVSNAGDIPVGTRMMEIRAAS